MQWPNKYKVREIVSSILDYTIFLSEEVQIDIEDVNEYAPEWSQDKYSGQVMEGEVSEMILRVTANDRDCSSKFSEICSYHIIGDEGPFLIDQGGVITNNVPLSWQKHKTHLLSVVATDCGGKESHPVLVEILTLPQCKTSWTGMLLFSFNLVKFNFQRLIIQIVPQEEETDLQATVRI